MDKIKIKDLEVFCNHGVLKEENVLGQKFLVSVTMYTNIRKAGMTDDLSQSIDYSMVSHKITTLLKEHTFQLIETVAEQVARELLLAIQMLEKVTVEIKKPWAPVGLPLDTVSVEITRGWHTAYIGLGSNMGNRQEYLNMAVESLAQQEDCDVMRCSDFIETEPYGGVEQEPFLNGCLELRTLKSPRELLHLLHKIEKEAHRERTIHWGPRTLDLDILFYDDLILDTETLIIPHMDMKNRDFVLQPLNQIAPYMRHPVYQKTVAQMWEELLSKEI